MYVAMFVGGVVVGVLLTCGIAALCAAGQASEDDRKRDV